MPLSRDHVVLSVGTHPKEYKIYPVWLKPSECMVTVTFFQ